MKLTKSKITLIVGAALGVVAILLLFLDGITLKGIQVSNSPSVFNIIFGTGTYLKGFAGTFNVVLFIPFVLLLASIALAIVGVCKDVKAIKIVTFILFAVVGIFFFFTKKFSIYSVPKGGVREGFKVSLQFLNRGVGAILSGIVCLASSAVICIGTFALKD